MRTLTCIAPLLWLCFAVSGGAVDLTVHNRSGVTLTAQPVRGGIPFARGELREPRVRLVDDRGAPLPCQARPLAHWYDGSIKWLLVDTQVSLGPDQQAKLRLQPGAPAPGTRRIKVEENPAEVVVHTGAARFVFSRTAFSCPAAAWLDLDGDGTCETQAAGAGSEFVCDVQHEGPGAPNEENWLRDAGAGPRERFGATVAGDYTVVVEHAHDLRAVIRLSGWLTNSTGRRLIQYVIRAHAYAGRTELKLCPTVVYAGKAKEDFIRALSLRFPTVAATDWALGGQKRHQGKLHEAGDVRLCAIGPEKIYHLSPYDQDKSVRYTVTQDGREIGSGLEPAGWARLSGSTTGLDLAVRDFWQMHPKEIALQRDAVTLYLWPESGNKVLDLRRRYDEVENTYHYDLSLWPYGGEGVGVTHEVLLRYGRAGDDTAAALSATLNRSLWLQCAPQYYADTGVFGRFLPVDRQRFPHLEAKQDVGVAWIQRNQQQFHWDGLLDYGDTLFHGYNTPSHYGYVAPKGWCSRGYVGWLNDDGGLTHALFIQALRSGDYDTFRTATAMARHSMDVDTCHYCAAEPRSVGGGHRHDQQHWGNGTRGYGTATHGIIDDYLLTGNERALDVALETAQYHIAPNGEDEDRPGGLIRIWEITGDSKYKAAADKIMAGELARPASPTWFFTTPGHFRMVLNTSTGFVFYLSAAPPADTARLREAIIRTIEANRDTYLSTWDDAGSYLPLLLAALACDLSGDPRHAEVLAALLQRLGLPRGEVPADLLATLRSTPFERLPQLVIGQWGVNNIYGLELAGFNAVPHVLAALTAAGLDEAGYLKVARVNTPVPPFEEVFDPKAIAAPGKLKGQDSHLFGYTLRHGAPDDRVGRSKLLLYEDGKLLGPPHSAHVEIMAQGKGRWSHWGARSIQFSSSDNSDPRTNGRQYRIVNPSP
jgi:hypothetical protein